MEFPRNIFDDFWTPQNYIPPYEHLIVLLIIDLTVILALVLIYKSITFQIKRSLKGPTQDSKIIMPSILDTSIKTIFIGLVFLPLSGLISHISGILQVQSYLIDPSCFFDDGTEAEYCYLLIGQEDILVIIGIQLIIIGLYNFFFELTRESTEDVINFNAFTALAILFFLSTIVASINAVTSTEGILFEVYFLYVTFYILNSYLIYKVIKAGRKPHDNPFIQIRKSIVKFLHPSVLIVLSIISFFFVPTQQYYPTRNAQVELYIYSYHLISVLIAGVMLFIVYLPKSFLEQLGYSEEDFIKYTDYRFDEPGKYSLRIAQLEDKGNAPPSDIDYIFAYENDESMLADQLSLQYGEEKVEFKQLDEETLQKLRLPNVDVIYLDGHNSKNGMYLLRRLYKLYGIKIQYNPSQVRYKNEFEFSDPRYQYSLITIQPSYWNIERKFWTVLFDPTQTLPILDFLTKYQDFLEQIAYRRQIVLLLLRFKKEGDKVQPIPPIAKGVLSPDPAYIQLLSY